MPKQAKHPKLCQCASCVSKRYGAWLDNLESFKKEGGGILPSSPEQTVMVPSYRVRSHYRRNPRHMTKDPGLRSLVHDYLESATKVRLMRRIKRA